MEGIFEKYTNIKFQENPFGGEPRCCMRAGGRIDKTDGDNKHDEANSRILQLCKRAQKSLPHILK
jgi:hypothetical protein